MLFIPNENIEIFDEDSYFEKMAEVESELKRCATCGHFKSFDGNEIYYEYYLTVNSRASIIIVHGYSEFSKKYHELCYYFLNSGFNVFLYDHRGHGMSCRQTDSIYINHVDDFNDYVKDLEYYVNEIVEPVSKDTPIHIYSHSMGGAISALYLAESGSKIQKAILSSPMIYPVCTPLPRRILRGLMAREARKIGWEAKFKFCSPFNPDIKYEENKSDLSEARFLYNLNMRRQEPRYQNSMSSNRWNYEVLGVMDRIFRKCRKNTINAEVYIISALDDEVVRVRPQKKLAKQLGCRYTGLKNARHSICTSGKQEFSDYYNLLVGFY